ncbi:helix-turn-helix domain-containing protein [Nocardiaceae bacterium NPDC056970]
MTSTVVDFFTWNRDFHGIRPRGTEDARPGKLNAAAHAVACAIAAHVNNKTRHARIGIRRIAESAQVSTSTAQKAVDALEAAGWLHVVRSEKRGTSTYMLVSPVAELRAAQKIGETADEGCSDSRYTGVAIPGTGVAIPDTELRSSLRDTTTSEKGSAPAQARQAPAVPMPGVFEPNNANRASAAAAGIDLDVLVPEMREWSRICGKNSRDWHATLGEFISMYQDGTHDGSRWDGLDYEHTVSDAMTRNRWFADLYGTLGEQGLNESAVPEFVWTQVEEWRTDGASVEQACDAIVRHRNERPDLYSPASAVGWDLAAA